MLHIILQLAAQHNYVLRLIVPITLVILVNISRNEPHEDRCMPAIYISTVNLPAWTTFDMQQNLLKSSLFYTQ